MVPIEYSSERTPRVLNSAMIFRASSSQYSRTNRSSRQSPTREIAGRLDDGAHLRAINLGIAHAQAAAAMAEHGVELVQQLRLALETVERHADFRGQPLKLAIRMRDELVQRRVKQADGDGQA